jgi:hypothetical protein
VLTPPNVASIVVVPVPVVKAEPLLLMIATVTSEELQVTCEARFSFEPSLNVPFAENDCRLPSAMFGFAGVIAIAVKVALVTVKVDVPATPAREAVIVAEPGAFPATMPNNPEALLIVATVELEDVHATEFVISWVVPSVSVPVAVKPVDVPAATVGVVGEMVMPVNPSTVKLAVPLTPFREQVIVTEPFATPETIFALSVATLVSDEVQVPTVSIC